MTTKKPRLKLKLKTKAPVQSKVLADLKTGKVSNEFKEDVDNIVESRRTSELIRQSATVEAEKARTIDTLTNEKTTYFNENNQEIKPKQMSLYQDIISSFYESFVCLTDDQVEDLESKLPKTINGAEVKVGHKAVYPPILDKERKKLSRARVIQKANRLRYIESDTTRGLKMPEELQNPESEKAQIFKTRQAKKDLVRTLIALNYNDYEMCEYLEISYKQLATLKKEVFFEELAVHRQMTNEELFVQYKLQQMEVIKDLDVIIERFKGSKQLTALAAALRNKSDIYNEIISKGYDFGVIDKTPEKSTILVGNIDIATASLDDLKQQLSKTQNEINDVVTRENFLVAGVIEKDGG